MQWKLIPFLLVLLIPARACPMDFMVELFEEHYKEKLVTGAGEIKVYHTWQVTTEYGDKLLVLIGDDYDYRLWLRQYADRHKCFIVKVPDQGYDQFIYSRTVPVDVQQVHAVRDKTWKCKTCRHGAPPRHTPNPQGASQKS